MNIKKMLPEDKHDLESVKQLGMLSIDELKEILPVRMDTGWELAHFEIRRRFTFKIWRRTDSSYTNVFKTRDSTWEYFMLTGLISRLPSKYLVMLKGDLERI